ncbi:MAG: DUF4157 domain-containing protein [Acidobacteriota bacterium]
MNSRQTTLGAKSSAAVSPTAGLLLQRVCACGQHTIAGGGCAECSKGALQRKNASDQGMNEVPPIVHDVLHSPGQPLDSQARAATEPRFDNDFSRVRVHSDAKAAESAQTVSARAYAVGRNIVFGPGQYAPETSAGKELLAHELAHVVQQGQTTPAFEPLAISSPGDRGEREADSAAHQFVAGGPIPALSTAAAAIHRQPPPGPAQSSGTHTITDRNSIIRDGPPNFKETGKKLVVGQRVDIIETQTTTRGTFVNLVEDGTNKALGWTSNINLGDVQYEQAKANFVYMAQIKPRDGYDSDQLPVMVYLPPNFDGKKADVLIYFHGDAADYSAGIANNYDRENPAIGMDLSGVAGGANRIIIAPQVNEKARMKSPWNVLHAGDYESIVQTVFKNLESDLKLGTAISRGSFSLAGHSGGGKPLGQAAEDLDQTGGGVTDVTLVDAGYGGGEDKAGSPDGGFAISFQMVRNWLLTGKREKVLRIITKASSPGADTRHAVENRPAETTAGDRIAVLGVVGVTNAIKAKGLDGTLKADATEITDTVKRTGGMQLIRKIVVSNKADGKNQGTIYLFLMANPPRGKDVDTHFGTRSATIGDIASSGSKGDDFGVKP